ncbi:hypothetical protein PHYSODRAFT_512077, partial [Phytophthora sojae]
SLLYGSPTTTNNQAEYNGLLTGLVYAHRANIDPLFVVGDSQLIIRQQRTRAEPRAHHLRQLYMRCRGLADKCKVVKWTHQLRVFNKTADSLANLAMDTARSRQVIFSPETTDDHFHTVVMRYAAIDLRKWLDD